MNDSMLTTVDNPHNPFTQYSEWFAFDARMGYHTPSYLARVVVTSDELSEADQQFVIDKAIDEIIEMNGEGMYKKVMREAQEGESSTVDV